VISDSYATIALSPDGQRAFEIEGSSTGIIDTLKGRRTKIGLHTDLHAIEVVSIDSQAEYVAYADRSGSIIINKLLTHDIELVKYLGTPGRYDQQYRNWKPAAMTFYDGPRCQDTGNLKFQGESSI
jgi:hypothetical protein